MVRAWRHQWASFGRNADRNAACRGGVFAVPREDSPAHRHPPPCAQAAPMKPPWPLWRRGVPRRDKKTHVSLRGMARAWRHQWASFGRNADRHADCRCGVFAVPREDSPAHRHPPPCAQAAPMKPPWPLWRRGVPRRDKKTHVSLRGMARAWRHQWASFGRNADRDADCRGGVFAVPREDSPAHPGSPRRGSLLEYGGLNPILTFLGGRSDAACRVVIRLHASHLWGLLVFVTTWRAAL